VTEIDHEAEEQPFPEDAEPTLPSEPTALPRPGRYGCHGVSVSGQPCNAHPVWNRGPNGERTTLTRYCYRHSLSDAEWKEKASKGGRTAHGERLYRQRFVAPERARELLRVFVAVVNEVYTVDAAVERLMPFFAVTEHDAALLADELRKLRTLTEIREERRVEYRTLQILEQTEGVNR
jgi:hypothetical protein